MVDFLSSHGPWRLLDFILLHLQGARMFGTDSRRGISLLELIIVMLILGLVASIFFPLVVRTRAKARQSGCSYKLRKVMRGVLRYEQTNGRFPPGRLKPDRAYITRDGIFDGSFDQTSYPRNSKPGMLRYGNFSVHVWILPYVNEQDVYDLIDFDLGQNKQLIPGAFHYEAYTQPMPRFICPADGNTSDPPIAENNYRSNFGGDTPSAGCSPNTGCGLLPEPDDIPYSPGGNGAFTYADVGFETGDYPDGLSKTVFFSERIKGTADSVEDSFTPRVTDLCGLGRGNELHNREELLTWSLEAKSQEFPLGRVFSHAGRFERSWVNGWPVAGYDATQYNHVAPPNWEGIDCGVNSFIPDKPFEHALVAARSYHPNSVNVAYGDGRVKRIRDNIDLPVWRTLGTRNGEEED